MTRDLNYTGWEAKHAAARAHAALTRAADACSEAAVLATGEPGAALDTMRDAQSMLDDANGAFAEAMRAVRKAVAR